MTSLGPPPSTIDTIATSLPAYTATEDTPSTDCPAAVSALSEATTIADYVAAAAELLAHFRTVLKPTGWAILHIPVLSREGLALPDDPSVPAAVTATQVEPSVPLLREVLGDTWHLPTEVFWRPSFDDDSVSIDVPDQPLLFLTPATETDAEPYLDRHHHSSGYASGAVWPLSPDIASDEAASQRVPPIPRTAMARALALVTPRVTCAQCRAPFVPTPDPEVAQPSCTCGEDAGTAPPTLYDPCPTPAVTEAVADTETVLRQGTSAPARLDAYTPLDTETLTAPYHDGDPPPSLHSIFPAVDV